MEHEEHLLRENLGDAMREYAVFELRGDGPYRKARSVSPRVLGMSTCRASGSGGTMTQQEHIQGGGTLAAT